MNSKQKKYEPKKTFIFYIFLARLIMNKSVLTIIILVTTFGLSSPSFAEWTKVTVGMNKHTFYFDPERVRQSGEYHYAWEMIDFAEPTESGDLSAKVYLKIDCGIFRYQNLQYSFHKQAMGRGQGDMQDPVANSQGWKYPAPNSNIEAVLNAICNN